jgi:hypothetical protein
MAFVIQVTSSSEKRMAGMRNVSQLNRNRNIIFDQPKLLDNTKMCSRTTLGMDIRALSKVAQAISLSDLYSGGV